MTELVSILIPAFNAQKHIAATINSALLQDWPDTEIIVVDDGSTDNTFPIAKEFESKRLKLVAQGNKGASAARNTALRHAQGDFIQWLDADDLLAPHKIARQMTLYREGGERDLISGAFGTFHVQPKRATFQRTSLWQDLTPVDFLVHICNENVWMSPAVWLVSRRVTEQAGPWDERLSLDDDGEYFSRVVAASARVRFCATAKIYYRQHFSGSVSRDVSYRACESLLLSLQLRLRELRKLEDSERTRSAGINLLQTWLEYFYPEKPELLSQAYDLAAELGGKLATPRLGWKYAPVRAMFGWPAAKRVRRIVANVKMRVKVRVDELVPVLGSGGER